MDKYAEAEKFITESTDALNNGVGGVVTDSGAVSTDTLGTDHDHPKGEISYPDHDNSLETSEGLND